MEAWRTDRRRQLRNQLFLAKLDAGIVARVARNRYFLHMFIFIAVFFSMQNTCETKTVAVGLQFSQFSRVFKR